jgi:hypothetical protein
MRDLEGPLSGHGFAALPMGVRRGRAAGALPYRGGKMDGADLNTATFRGPRTSRRMTISTGTTEMNKSLFQKNRKKHFFLKKEAKTFVH